MRYLLCLFVVCSFLPISASADEIGPGLDLSRSLSAATSGETKAPLSSKSAAPSVGEVSSTCCKICRTGKACGNSCISVSKTCHQPPGCACDR